jgi:hypothetical protein
VIQKLFGFSRERGGGALHLFADNARGTEATELLAIVVANDNCGPLVIPEPWRARYVMTCDQSTDPHAPSTQVYRRETRLVPRLKM